MAVTAVLIFLLRYVDMNNSRKLEPAVRQLERRVSSSEQRKEAIATFKARYLAEPRAAFYLGVCFDIGFGVKPDKSKAFECYEVAAKGGRRVAAYNIYLMCRDGIGTSKNIGTALFWLKQSANKGDIDAIRDLGWHLHEGVGVRRNLKEAAKMYRRAAKAGDAIAQWNLGCCYNDAEGVARSVRWSNYWMKKAAAQGHKAARNFLKTIEGKLA